jgi:hypothetical protein
VAFLGGALFERVGTQVFVKGVEAMASPGARLLTYHYNAAGVGMIEGGRALAALGVGVQYTSVALGGFAAGFALGTALVCVIDPDSY